MKLEKAAVVAALLPMFVVYPAKAELISDFSLLGGNSTTIGSNVLVNNGLVGSNKSVSLGANVATHGVSGGSNFSALGNSVALPTGNIVFNGNVAIPANAHVSGSIDSGGNVTAGTNAAIAGGIRAAGSVAVQDLGSVGGNIHAGAPGTAVTLGNLVNVTGTVTHNAAATHNFGFLLAPPPVILATPTAPSLFGGVTLPAAHAFSAGVIDVTKPANTTTTLLPGSYDDLNLGANNVLNLSTGKYRFDTWTIANNAVLNLDLTGGAIELYFTGGVNIASNFIMNLLGGDASDVYAETLADWLMGDNVNWFGTIFGSGESSNVTLGNNHHLVGGAYATRDLRLGDNSIVDFAWFDGAQRPLAVLPLPATLWLFGLGVAGIAALRRRH